MAFLVNCSRCLITDTHTHAHPKGQRGAAVWTSMALCFPAAVQLEIIGPRPLFNGQRSTREGFGSSAFVRREPTSVIEGGGERWPWLLKTAVNSSYTVVSSSGLLPLKIKCKVQKKSENMKRKRLKWEFLTRKADEGQDGDSGWTLSRHCQTHTRARSKPPRAHLPIYAPAHTRRQDLTSEMEPSPQRHSQAHQLASGSKGSAHSSRTR